MIQSKNAMGILNLWMCSFASLTAVNVFQGFRHSPRHARRSAHARVTEEKPGLVQIPESEPDSSSGLRKRKVKKRVLPEFYQSVQVTPTRKLVGTNSTLTMINSSAAFVFALLSRLNVSVNCPRLQFGMKWKSTSHFLAANMPLKYVGHSCLDSYGCRTYCS